MDEGAMNPVKRMILEAAAAIDPAGCVSRRPVVLRQDILDVEALASSQVVDEKYLDVPIDAIAGLGHANSWFQANGRNFERRPSWVEVLESMHCEDWDDRVFDYFEGELEDKVFPAKNARGLLELVRVGRGYFCVNGIHRLAAQILWLEARHGKSAVLRKVKIVASLKFGYVESLLRSVLEDAYAKLYLWMNGSMPGDGHAPVDFVKGGILVKLEERDSVKLFCLNPSAETVRLITAATPSSFWRRWSRSESGTKGEWEEATVPFERYAALLEASKWKLLSKAHVALVDGWRGVANSSRSGGVQG